jgi:hypothetical protein
LFEVVERLTASLNSFTCLGEAVPGFVGAGFAFLTVSVEPGTLISCRLSKLISEPMHLSSMPGERM